jgi:hypothetical protein
MSRELTEEQRWKVANQLNELPTVCWADLVDWALKGAVEIEDEDNLGESITSPVPVMSGGVWCALNAQYEGGYCYCGQRRTGREITDGR